MNVLPKVLISILLITSCQEKDKQSNSHTYTIDGLLITLPLNYQLIHEQGTDSDVYEIVSKKKDSIYVSYGYKGIINDLYETPVAVWHDSLKIGVIERFGREPKPDEVVFSEFPKDDEKQGIFEKNYFVYDTINNIVVKIVQPKRIGNGITGLNIPKLRDGMSFTIRGDNLDSTTHQDLLKMFRTLKYKE